MRDNIKEIVRIASRSFRFPEPVVEVGSFQVAGQEGYADLRGYFPNQRYIGCDMREGAGVDQLEDIEKGLSFEDGSVGAVVSCDTLEHVFDVFRFMEETNRVLMRGGYALHVSLMCHPIHNHPHDYWRFTPECFRRLLEKIGEPLILAQGAPNFPHTVIGIVRKGEPLPRTERERFMEAMDELSSQCDTMELDVPSHLKRSLLALGYHEEAYTRLLAGRHRDARESSKRAIRLCPLHLKSYVYWLFTFFPHSVYAAVRRVKKALWP
ncbi:MAG: methyltransferase domain-containing protein [Acidobacteriota bacterium]|nr:MAG: methyltransferase domain-containing protein [Acidobacteriota bacterium]